MITPITPANIGIITIAIIPAKRLLLCFSINSFSCSFTYLFKFKKIITSIITNTILITHNTDFIITHLHILQFDLSLKTRKLTFRFPRIFRFIVKTNNITSSKERLIILRFLRTTSLAMYIYY